MGSKFVVQEHHARTKHFDFRLQIGGVLKSWALPKGVSKDPSVKRLAIQTTDHSLSYANYEDEDVIIWDRGTYINLAQESMTKQWRNGHIKVELHGKKLKGGFALTRFSGDDRWLLVKMRNA